MKEMVIIAVPSIDKFFPVPEDTEGHEIAVLDDGSEILLKPYKDDSPDTDKVYYQTQFMTLNLSTGRNIRDPHTDEIISKPRGIRSGGMILMSGRQGIGKTTLASNISGHIKRQCDDLAVANFMPSKVQIYYATTEDGMEKSNIMKNLYIDKKQADRGELIIIPPDQMSTESLADTIDEISEWKEKNKEQLMFPQPCVGGGMKMEYIPTILFVDSLTGLAPRSLKNKKDNEVNNMYAAQRNKENAVLLINKFEKLRKYNIITIWIVHCGFKFSTNGLPNQKDYQALSADVKVSDGKTPQYFADLFMFINKITDYEGKAKSISDIISVDDRYIGYAVEVLTPKNRWGDSSIRSNFRLVSDSATGFNALYSFLYEFHSRGLIKYGKMEGYDKKIVAANIPKLLEEDPEFLQAVKNAMDKEFEWLLEASNKAIPRYLESRKIMDRLIA